MSIQIKENDIIEGPFWPEPVRVIKVDSLQEKFQVKAVGIHLQKFYDQIISHQQLEKVRVVKSPLLNFKGDSLEFFLGIEVHRIRFAYQFDPFWAVNVSQIDALPHQIEAIYQYILQNPKIRFLLADDPGAGKTIMAGLLLKELKYRGLVERCLIVVPGHLKDQWQRELKEKFNESFFFVNREVLRSSWGRNIWQDQNQIIASMDFAKKEDVLIGLAETFWDLVIVDEAHKMSAYKYGEKIQKRERYKLGEVLSRNSKFLLFLTATPHRGDPENFRLFLNLLEPNLFADVSLLEESVRNKENRLFLRRLKEDLKNFDNTPLFPPRKVEVLPCRLNDEEMILYNKVTQYVREYYQVALRKEKRGVAFALMILQRRLASSIYAIRKSLERRKARLEHFLSLGELKQQDIEITEEYLEDLPEAERWRQEELLEKLTSADSLPELKQEIEKIEELIKLSKNLEQKEIETKIKILKEVMGSLRKSGEKLLVFTESRETLEYLVKKIRGWGFSCTFIHGGMDLDKRIQAEHEFKNTTQIMVATEAAGEGINLQFCWLMVNYDIPWNPNRLEQRMGRIHRYGQQHEVHIYNLVATNTIEGRILKKLFDKLKEIRFQLGSERVFDVIGDMVPGKSLKDLIEEAIANPRKMEDILEKFERTPNQELINRIKEATLQSLATRHIDLSKILEESQRAKENRLVPEYIEKFFLKAASYLNLKVEKTKDSLYRVPSLPYEFRNITQEFKNKFGQVYKEYRKISFYKEEAQKKEAEFVAPGHPLLEVLIEKILSSSNSLREGAQFLDPSGKLEGLIWFLEFEIKDGNGISAGKRIYAIYQAKDNKFTQIPASILWDLKPTQSLDIKDLIELQNNRSELINFAITNILSTYIEELRVQRERDAQIKRKYGLRSLDKLISELESKLTDYEIRRAKGESIPEAIIQREQRTKNDLISKREKLLKDMEREVNLLPSSPVVLGVICVKFLKGEEFKDALSSDLEIEKIGMKIALEYEIEQGRNPTNVSSENLGFDIRSQDRKGNVRYIEVKARARTGKIVLTPNEWFMANRLQDDYYLYIVENAKTNPQLYIIQNPAKNLKPDEEVEIVRYVVKDWKNVAKIVGV
ncbi:MAG: helicase [Candidatus Omnitrophica bacterium 4484_70.2]|nr:MAG: helicase [Candidatus Omnitrophica bacterium 4484_70.2]